MCHRRRDRSGTSSSASEPEPEENSTRWPSRAAGRLVAFVSTGGTESDRETPDSPAIEADPETPTPTENPDETGISDESETTDEREEDPIPADD
jgi:hypothetical protein